MNESSGLIVVNFFTQLKTNILNQGILNLMGFF